jgi:hypothetical protein
MISTDLPCDELNDGYEIHNLQLAAAYISYPEIRGRMEKLKTPGSSARGTASTSKAKGAGDNVRDISGVSISLSRGFISDAPKCRGAYDPSDSLVHPGNQVDIHWRSGESRSLNQSGRTSPHYTTSSLAFPQGRFLLNLYNYVEIVCSRLVDPRSLSGRRVLSMSGSYTVYNTLLDNQSDVVTDAAQIFRSSNETLLPVIHSDACNTISV